MDLSNICKSPNLFEMRSEPANALRDGIASTHQGLISSSPLRSSARQSSCWRSDDPGRHRAIFSNWLVRFRLFHSETDQLTLGDSQSVIVGCYVIIFGAGQPHTAYG